MKKVFKVLGIVIGSITLLLIISFIIFSKVLEVKNDKYIGKADKHFVDYLNKNKVVLDDSIYNTKAILFDEETYNSNIILLGENHGIAEIQTIDKNLFLHLNKKAGVHYYIAEMDSTRSNKLNAFLNKETKDSSLLKEFVLEMKQRIPQQASLELYEKWSDIYDYNKNLPDSSKLHIIGIDKDFNDESTIPRDSAMIQNFKTIIKKNDLENEKFYGLFGFAHILQEGVHENNFHYFSSRLISNGYKTTSILCLNVDCKVYFPKEIQFPIPIPEQTEIFNLDGPGMVVKGINDLKKSSKKNNATLFYLKGLNTPYKKGQKLITMKVNFFGQSIMPFNKELPTTDFIQYAIIVRNSKGNTPLY